MSVFSRLERHAASQVVPKPFINTFGHSSTEYTHRRSYRQPSSKKRHRTFPGSDIFSSTDFFINSLVNAGYCKKHAPCTRRFLGSTSKQPTIANTASAPAPKPAPGLRGTEAMIYRSLKAELPPGVDIDHKAYLAAKRIPLSNYRELFGFFRKHLGYIEGTKALMVALSNPNSEMRIDGNTPSHRIDDDMEISAVRNLISLLENDSISNQTIFSAYQSLPAPRVSCLSHKTRKALLHRFANPSRRHQNDALRYLSIIEDMCEASLPVAPSLWTAAIVLAGKKLDKASKSSLQSALGVWRRMEYEGKIPSTSVAFNILFDMAIKAGQYKVADRIVKEMQSRNIDPSRFGGVSRIFYFGIQGDAAGVRQEYSNFVRAGEIVDTTVLNCVMASLIRTGHLELAEQMYDNMKSMHHKIMRNPHDSRRTLAQLPSKDYISYRKANKYLGRILSVAAYLHDKLPEHHRALQAAIPLTPDAKTFHVFLSYHALVSGNLERFLTLLHDMETTFEIRPQGMAYLFLFEGFAKHGGRSHTHWNYRRLRRAWNSFLRDLYNSEAQELPRVQKRISKLIWNARLGTSEYDSDDSAEDYQGCTSVYEDGAVHGLDTNYPEGTINGTSSGRENEEENDDEYNDEYYEQGVFLGRRIIIACLRAHYACGGQKAVLRVWQQIKPLWCPRSQRLKDSIAVDKILHSLLHDQYL